ncbi:MAG: hypothetical protein FJ405_17060, partial [Verrucomicrobia bacterium]|nr:hypothetical protein [Verrucomicrobiota bacterium]
MLVAVLAIELCFNEACLANGTTNVAEIRSVRQLQALSPEQARGQIPVRLRGVVTFHEPTWFQSFFQDPTGGIYVMNYDPSVRAGDEVEVEGSSSVGSAGSVIVARGGTNQARLRVLGKGSWPEAKLVTAEEVR